DRIEFIRKKKSREASKAEENKSILNIHYKGEQKKHECLVFNKESAKKNKAAAEAVSMHKVGF
ncbi:hypothetical protein LJC56_00695, partial [Christensenellaceae bacterium OttesenSCG-928-K19]|nr:hypothetical protein [Christensenellaceae bacterium OttesenSCG-928-K19]